MGTNYSGDDDFEQTNPLDLVVGPVFWIKPGFFIRPGHLLEPQLQRPRPGLRLQELDRPAHLDRLPPRRAPAARSCTPPPPPPPPANGNPTVSCEVERTNLLPGESTRRARDRVRSRRRPAHLRVERHRGHASPAPAPAVTFNSTGMAPGASATITVRVSDGRSGPASATCPVARHRPDGASGRRPSPASSGGFPPQPRPPQQRGQGLPGRRGHAACAATRAAA